jgi:predicted enzyme related to lactoylglutathione lyase
MKSNEKSIHSHPHPMITEIAFVATPVTNINRARAFYEGVLQLKPADVACDGHWIEYSIGTETFAITNINPEWTPSRQGTSVAFEVDDLDDVMSLLKAHGAGIVEDVFETPACRMALVLDPDGNTLAIHKRKP